MAKIKVCNWTSPAWRERNKPMAKMNREQLERALNAGAGIREESAAIRARLGLPPVPDTTPRREGLARLAMLVAKAEAKPRAKASRATSAAAASPGSPRDTLTPETLEAWRRKHEREAEEIRAAAVAMFRDRVAGATRIGQALGVKRQRVYQLAA